MAASQEIAVRPLAFTRVRQAPVQRASLDLYPGLFQSARIALANSRTRSEDTTARAIGRETGIRC